MALAVLLCITVVSNLLAAEPWEVSVKGNEYTFIGGNDTVSVCEVRVTMEPVGDGKHLIFFAFEALSRQGEAWERQWVNVHPVRVGQDIHWIVGKDSSRVSHSTAGGERPAILNKVCGETFKQLQQEGSPLGQAPLKVGQYFAPALEAALSFE